MSDATPCSVRRRPLSGGPRPRPGPAAPPARVETVNNPGGLNGPSHPERTER